MRHARFLVLLGMSAPAWAQSQAAWPVTPQPVVVGERADVSLPESAPVAERITEGAESAPAQLDDGVPSPNAAVVRSTPEGDVVVEPAAGDPFTLGFMAGGYRPAENELIDPELVARIGVPFVDERPADDTYVFAMFRKRITPERLRELEALGARVLGFHPEYAMKLAVPTEQIDVVAAHPAIRWVGVPKSWQKLHPELDTIIARHAPSDLLAVYVNVFESDLCEASTSEPLGQFTLSSPSGVEAVDPAASETRLPRVWQSNGWMHRALEANGALVRSYVDRQRAFRVFVPVAQLDELAALDFVQFIEPEVEPTPAHDESTSMILADRVRTFYDGSANEAAVVGIIDTGLDNTHSDLGIWGVGWACTGTGGAWVDADGHGTRVASTILGRGFGDTDHKGVAPGLASWGGDSRLFNVRAIPGCSWPYAQTFDVLETPYNDGSNTTPAPHVVNCSWGTSLGSNPSGTDIFARTVDDQVYFYNQAYVFAAGNEGPGSGTLRLEAAAKNVITVGNVTDYRNSAVGDPGTVWTTSSRGPTGDGRFKPNVTAPGRWIRAANANTSAGYVSYAGTSGAAAHVTGTIAQLVDRWSYLRYRPHTIASLLMGTAMTKDNLAVQTNSSHMDSYGAGRVEAYKAAYDNSQFGILQNNNLNVSAGTWYWGDFTVSASVTRLVVVMHYTEAAASSGASQALVNDWDLWIDAPPIESGGNTGEWFAQQSSVDNTEIRILDSPITGTWRWKAYPKSVTGSAKMSVTVHAIYGDTTPAGSLTLDASDTYVVPNEDVQFTATVTNPEYVASAIFLDTSGSGHSLQSTTTMLNDGTVADLTDNPHGGYDVSVGDLLYGTSRTVNWTTQYPSEGVKEFTVNARSDNWTDRVASVNVTVDGTPPTPPTDFGSSTHTPNEWSNEGEITFTWTPSTDAVAGLAGYDIRLSIDNPSNPGTQLDIGDVSSHTEVLGSSASGRYLNLKPVDLAGNWSPDFESAGPYFVDVDDPSALTGLVSTTHDVDDPSCLTTVTMDWDDATDPHSGVAGYSFRWSHSPTSAPNDLLDTTESSLTEELAPSTLPWYFHVKALDEAGNSSANATSGPYFIEPSSAANYCVAALNSTGQGGVMGHSGSLSVSANDLVLEASNLPPGQPCLFFYAGGQATSAFGNGFLCLAGQIIRLDAFNVDGSGFAAFAVDYTDPPSAIGEITAGSTWNFQNWYRDPFGGGALFNLSDGLEVTFCP